MARTAGRCIQILDVLQQRSPVQFSVIAVNVDSGYKEYKHDVIARTCRERGWELRIEHTGIGELDRGHPRRRPDALLALRAPAPGRVVPDRQRGRRIEDRARPPHGRLHRDAAAEPVLRRRPQGHAGKAGVRRWGACGDPAAGRTSAKTKRGCTPKRASCRSSAAAVRHAATCRFSGSASNGCSWISRSRIRA